MPNPNILFQNIPTKTPQEAMQGVLQNQAVLNQFQQQPMQNRLLEAQTVGQEQLNQSRGQQMDQEYAKFALQDLATDWGSLKPLLASGDMTNANVAIAQRIDKILKRKGDPSDTIELRDRINSGQITPQQAIAEVDGALEGARSAGLLGKGSADDSYYTTVQTSSGVYRFNNRTGQYEPMAGPDGKPVLPTAVDPNAQAAVAGARQNAQNVSDLTYKPKIAEGEKRAELTVEGQLKPGIERDVAKARAEAEDLVAQTISKRSSSNSLESAQLLKSNLTGNLDKIYGRGESLYPDLLRSQKGIDLIADRNQLVGMLTLAGRGQLKGQGPLTDQEQKTVQQAISVMSNPDISPARAEIALNDAFKVLETAAGRPQQPAQGGKQGGQIMIDANGNRAMVYPDGSFEEMP